MAPTGYVYVVSLGCPKNLVDTEVLTATLFRAGLGMATDPERADLYLVSTCAFIAAARTEAAGELALAVAWKRGKPGRRVAVCGCLPQWDARGEYRAQFPEVDAWLGLDQAPQMGTLLGQLLAGMGVSEHSASATVPHYLYDHLTPRLQLTPAHYAYLKIADGCDNRCAYCSIPRIRGELRSRQAQSVVKEAQDLIANGVRELILIAQDLTAFGLDRPAAGEDLPGLLRALDALPGKFWIRLLYAHPASLLRTPQFFAAFTDCFHEAQHLLPYLDLPLQHCTDRMLARMGRRVTATQVAALPDQLRAAIPGLTLRTTFLVGHPGETAADFQALRRFTTAAAFDRMGVFTYSPEPETPAATQDATVAPATAERRAAELAEQQAQLMRLHNAQLIGREVECLVDEVAGSVGRGRTAMDAPDIDLTLQLAGAQKSDLGKFRQAVVTAAETYELSATMARKRHHQARR